MQELRNKLRLKSQILKKLQGMVKTNGRNVAPDMTAEYERLMADKEAAVKESARLAQENVALGKIVDKLRQQEKAKIDYSNEELKKALLDLTDEFEKYKREYTVDSSLREQLRQLQEKLQQTINKHEEERRQLVAELQSSQAEAEELAARRRDEVEGLLDSNRKLNDGHDEVKVKYEFYKSKYLEEVKAGDRLQEKHKALLGEEQSHLEYIQLLETKNRELESRLTEAVSAGFDRTRLRSTSSSRTIRGPVVGDTLEDELEQSQAEAKELVVQFRSLKESKELAQNSLVQARQSLVQRSLELKESQDKLVALEKMRLSDLLHITRLENLLDVHSIKY